MVSLSNSCRFFVSVISTICIYLLWSLCGHPDYGRRIFSICLFSIAMQTRVSLLKETRRDPGPFVKSYKNTNTAPDSTSDSEGGIQQLEANSVPPGSTSTEFYEELEHVLYTKSPELRGYYGKLRPDRSGTVYRDRVKKTRLLKHSKSTAPQVSSTTAVTPDLIPTLEMSREYIKKPDDAHLTLWEEFKVAYMLQAAEGLFENRMVEGVVAPLADNLCVLLDLKGKEKGVEAALQSMASLANNWHYPLFLAAKLSRACLPQKIMEMEMNRTHKLFYNSAVSEVTLVKWFLELDEMVENMETAAADVLSKLNRRGRDGKEYLVNMILYCWYDDLQRIDITKATELCEGLQCGADISILREALRVLSRADILEQTKGKLDISQFPAERSTAEETLCVSPGRVA